jgi:hypothetical protein
VGEGEVCLPTPEANKKRTNRKRFLIMLLSSGLVWLVATSLFVCMQIPFPDGQWWLVFVYALMANMILFIVYASRWKYRILQFTSVSGLIWTAITCLYLTVAILVQWQGTWFKSLWFLYLIGIPLQVLEILWMFFRSLIWKDKKHTEKGEQENKQEG